MPTLIAKNKKRLFGNRRKTSRNLFFAAMAALPIIQFCIFYIGVNMNSLIMAFEKYDYSLTGFGFDITFAGFNNFSQAWGLLKQNVYMIKNSMIGFVTTLLISYPLSLIFSFYIYKKYPLNGLFKTVLFLPQIISGLIFAVLFKYMVGRIYVDVTLKLTGKEVVGFLSNPATRFGTIVFFNIWVSFGINVLMFSNAMSGIDTSVVESAQLDGVNIVQEFFHITLPSVWPTAVSFIIITTSGIFTNQMQIYNLYGEGGFDVASLGYYLYLKSTTSDLVQTASEPSYGIMSALGLILTFIVVPLTMLLKKFLTKVGPSAD